MSTSSQTDLPLASEFCQLSLLLAAFTIINRPDVYPTFTAHPEEKWAWHDATKLDPFPSVMNALLNTLTLNHMVLASMALGADGNFESHEDNEGERYRVDMAGLKVVVLPNPSKGSELDLNHIAVIPETIVSFQHPGLVRLVYVALIVLRPAGGTGLGQ